MLKPLLKKIPSHIQDYTDFLNKLNRFSKSELSDILLVSVDVADMYNSIKLDLGLDLFDVNFIIKGLV